MTEKLKIIKPDNLHASIMSYISDNNISIVEYENMKETILKMIRERYIFNMNRERLRDAMEDITYILSPEDDVNKDRVEKGLEYEYSDDEGDDSDDSDDDDICEEEGAELLKRMMDPTFMQQMNDMMTASISQPKKEPLDKDENENKEEPVEEPEEESDKEEPEKREPEKREQEEPSKEEPKGDKQE